MSIRIPISRLSVHSRLRSRNSSQVSSSCQLSVLIPQSQGNDPGCHLCGFSMTRK